MRDRLIRRKNCPNGTLHREALHFVSAAGQSDGLEAILPLLTEEEETLFKRGRNSDAVGHRNSDVIQYKRATGLETLFGYLYLTGQADRLTTLFDVLYDTLSEE